MRKNKKNILFLSILIVVAVCLTLVITPTFARYFKKITEKAFWLTYESDNAVYVYSEHITEDDNEWVRFDGSGFVQNTDSAILDFSIANGVSRERFAKRTQEVSVYLAVGSSIGASGEIAIELLCDGSAFVGKAEEIKEDSHLYSTFGPGWVYRFYDNDGKEMLFTLEGEAFCFENFTLTVKGTVEAALLDLRVTATYAQNK